MRHRISPATVIASVALFLSLGGVGIAATGYRITSLWQIAPKVRKQLRGTRGPAGAAGLQGPQGPVGPPGLTGPRGPAFLDARNANGPQVTIQPGQTSSSIATCPAGHYSAWYGGFIGDPGVSVYWNWDDGLGAWLVMATNPTSTPLKLEAWISCLSSTADGG